MNRRHIILMLASLAAACGPSGKALKDVLPVEVQRMWVLKETRSIAAADAPELVRGLGLKQALEAVYRANGTITVRLYEMHAEASAFELMQKWRQTESLAFHKGAYLVSASSGDVDPQTLREFTQALRTVL